MEQTGKRIAVEIRTSTILKTLLLLLLFAVLYVIRDVVLIALTAVVIASSVEPAIKWFAKYKISRVPAVILTYALITVFFVAVFYAVVPILLEDMSNFLTHLPTYLQSVGSSGVLTDANSQAVAQFSDGFSLSALIRSIQELSVNATSGAWGIILAVSGGAISFLLIIVLSIYLALQETGVDDFLEVVTPVKYHKYVLGLWKRSQIKIGRWMQGQILLAILVGVLVYLGLTILGVKYAFLLAIIAAIFEIIPVFGPIMAAIPAIAIAFVGGGVTEVVQVAALYVIIQQFESHLIYPLVVKKIVGIPALLVILALIIGGKLAGFFGIILSVPIAAVVQELVNDLRKGRASLEEVPDA